MTKLWSQVRYNYEYDTRLWSGYDKTIDKLILFDSSESVVARCSEIVASSYRK